MQGKKVILGTYNHLSPGSSDKAFEEVYQTSWRPFLSVLYKFPTISSVNFYSGTVLSWIETKHPEFLMLMEEMVDRKQVELLGGGFYSPLFPIIPNADKIGQVELLTTYIRKTFGKRPSGGWIYEYAWDSSIPSIFKNSGLSYTFLPERALSQLSLDPWSSEIALTEDQRKVIAVFPIFDLNEMPGGPEPFEKALAKIDREKPDRKVIPIMMNGNSASTAWKSSEFESPDVMFERTFAWFQKNCLEYETTSAQQAIKGLKPGRLVYFGAVSSKQFQGIAVDAAETRVDEAGPIVPQLHAKQLVADNSVSAKLNVKMNYVYTLIAVLRGDKARKKAAQENLWQAQSGDCYWESDGGGVRRPEIRVSAFSALIDAEKTTRLHANAGSSFILDDIDCDGEKELIYQAADYNSYLHLRGGCVFELDSFKTKHNYLCSYDPESEASGNCFLDSIEDRDPNGSNQRLDLSQQLYSIENYDKDLHRIVLLRKLSAKLGSVFRPLNIKKTFLFQKRCVSVDYEIANDSPSPCSLRFGSTLNLLPPGPVGSLRLSTLQSRAETPTPPFEMSASNIYERIDGFKIELGNEKEKIEALSDKRFALKVNHIFDAISPARQNGIDSLLPQNAYFQEKFYQGTRYSCCWDLDFAPDSTRTFSISLHLGS